MNKLKDKNIYRIIFFKYSSNINIIKKVNNSFKKLGIYSSLYLYG